jgi:HAD superfamily hydrolase (TIGR01484 family)
MIRLIATDLDGTVLRSDGTVSSRTRLALERVSAAGIRLVFVTARPARWMAPIAAMAGHNGIAVCANGAVTYDMRTDSVLDSYPIERETALEVVRRLRAEVPGGTFAVESAEGFASEPGHMQHQWDLERDAPVGDVVGLLERPAVKLLFGHPALSADEMLAVVRDAVGDLVEATHSNPERAAVELSAPGINKATTLARLSAGWGIDAAEVIAFGDMPNDLPMLGWAGTSVAVANAHGDVLAAVSATTGTNDEDGVAQVLERLLKSQSTARGGSGDKVATRR